MDVVVVLVVVFIVVAAAAAYIVLSAQAARAAREAERSVPVSRVAGLKLTPLADPLPVPRSVNRAPSTSAAPPVPGAQPQPPPATSAGAAPPPPLFDLDLEPAVVAPPVEILWWKQFDGRSAALDDTARLRLIGDLGVVAKEWCVPLLARAYQEERKAGHRQAALTALAACRSRAAIGTFRLALASDDAAERAIASDGLADLEPQPLPKIRRTVERH